MYFIEYLYIPVSIGSTTEYGELWGVDALFPAANKKKFGVL